MQPQQDKELAQQTEGDGQSVSDGKDQSPKTTLSLQRSSDTSVGNCDDSVETNDAAKTLETGSRKRSRSSSSRSSAGKKKAKRHPSEVSKDVFCVVEECNYKASTKSNMVQHLGRRHKDIFGGPLDKAMNCKIVPCKRWRQPIKINDFVSHMDSCLDKEMEDQANLPKLERLPKSAVVNPKDMPWEDVLDSFKDSMYATNIRKETADVYWSQLVKLLDWLKMENADFNPLLCMRGEQDFPSFEGYVQSRGDLIRTSCLRFLLWGYMKACSLIKDNLVRVSLEDPSKNKVAVDKVSLVNMHLGLARAKLKKIKNLNGINQLRRQIGDQQNQTELDSSKKREEMGDHDHVQDPVEGAKTRQQAKQMADDLTKGTHLPGVTQLTVALPYCQADPPSHPEPHEVSEEIPVSEGTISAQYREATKASVSQLVQDRGREPHKSLSSSLSSSSWRCDIQ